MLGIFVIFGCVLMTCAGPPISGYTLGTLSGGRGQEYISDYRTGGFIGMKDSQGDPSDRLGSGGGGGGAGVGGGGTGSYGSSVSNRYSVLTGGPSSHQSSGTSYTSDSGYSDASGLNPAVYGGQSTVGNSESMSPSGSSYTSDAVGSHGSSSDLGNVAYASSATSTGLGGYSSATATKSGNRPNSGFVGYSEIPGGHGISNVAERNHGDYSSSSHPSGSYVTYTIGGSPKKSAYTLSNGGQGHPGYSSGLSHGSVVHRGGSSQHPSTSYSSESGRPGFSSSSLASFLAGLQNTGHGNHVNVGGGSHRVSSSNHPFAMASNGNAIYSSRGPGSGYHAASAYPKGGGKIILVKESNGGHSGHVYSGEHHGYNGGTYGATNGGVGYKIRSVGSGPSYGPGHAMGYSSSGGYAGGHSGIGNSHGASFFGLL